MIGAEPKRCLSRSGHPPATGSMQQRTSETSDGWKRLFGPPLRVGIVGLRTAVVAAPVAGEKAAGAGQECHTLHAHVSALG